jgi:hypothetical protein
VASATTFFPRARQRFPDDCLELSDAGKISEVDLQVHGRRASRPRRFGKTPELAQLRVGQCDEHKRDSL